MFNIVSWNLNSALSKLPFLQLMCGELSPKIVCLQETKLLPNKSLFLKNFRTFRQDNLSALNASGGVLIAVHNSFHAEIVPLHTHFQAIAVRIHSSSPVTICCIYLHHLDAVTSMLLEELVNQLPKPYILTGDFNAHHFLWGSNKTDQRGMEIESFMETADVTLLNNGSPTHFNVYTGNTSAIDLSFCSPNLTHLITWSTHENLYSSDHFPQIMEILIVPTIPMILPQRWLLNKADWRKYEQIVDLSCVENGRTADEMVDVTVRQIILAANESIPLSSNFQKKHNPVPWWNADCEKAVKNKRKLFRNFKKYLTAENLSAFKIARATARREVFKSK